MGQAMLIIYVSVDDGKTWQVCQPQNVPDWIRNDPDVVANLLAGEMAQNKLAPISWYRGERYEPPQPQLPKPTLQ